MPRRMRRNHDSEEQNGEMRHIPLNSVALAASKALQQRSLDGRQFLLTDMENPCAVTSIGLIRQSAKRTFETLPGIASAIPLPVGS